VRLPRWTVYPALGILAGALVIGFPNRIGKPKSGGARGAATGVRTYEYPPLVILGVDGLDPEILAETVRLAPDLVPNFVWLIQSARGIQQLGTSIPPQSPVAWSNFITGLDPGGHGIFDFIHRDPITRRPIPSTSVEEQGSHLGLPGAWQIPLGGDVRSNRTGTSFWQLLRRAGIPADIWRIPANFPVEPSKGVSFSGMMTPTLDSAYGECSFFTTDPVRKVELEARYPKVWLVKERDGRIVDALRGPANPLRVYGPSEEAKERVPFTVYLDHEAGAAAIEVGDERVILTPGQWSDFLRVDFDMLPLGMMSLSGICRFYLRSIDPEFELYASPINLNPEEPPSPVAEPSEASADLVHAIGRYYTQGMAEDVNALKYEILTDEEFMRQVELVYDETNDMLDYALSRYVHRGEGGVMFFYVSSIDLPCHMMWRHADPAHPAHDPEFAAQSSEDWSHRSGSTWKETIRDLYIKIDPILGRIRASLGDDVPLIVMSDHGFAPYRRKFSLNTWLYEQGYLVLQAGRDKELPREDPGFTEVGVWNPAVVDWSKTRAYGMGFNGLYLNLAGREGDDPATADVDESGIVQPAESRALLQELKAKLEALEDPETGMKPILRCDLAADVYRGSRKAEAPDMIVGYNAGYGNSDPSSTGRIPNAVLEDNTGGTFNGNHLMAPEVVPGLVLSNKSIRPGEHRLEDLTVEVLRHYSIDPPEEMKGHPVLE
jgi:predicted AlkP superfamily phosphohydrolase/phosphomutase